MARLGPPSPFGQGLPPLRSEPMEQFSPDPQAELDEIMRVIYPNGVPQQPGAPQAPPVKFGRFNIPGQPFDDAAMAVLQQLQRTRAPRNFGEGFVQGAIGSLAGGRARGMQQRQAEFERQQKEADEAQNRRAQAGTTLALWRRDPNRIARSNQMFKLTAREAKALADPEYTAGMEVPGSIKAHALDLLKPPSPRDPLLAANTQSLIDERRRRAEEAANQAREEDAAVEQMAQDIARVSADSPPVIPARDKNRARTINRVNQILRENKSPFSFRQLEQLHKEADRISRVMNNPQNTRQKLAAQTTHDHLMQMERFYSRFWDVAQKKLNEPGVLGVVSRVVPKELRQSNSTVLWMAQNGMLGPEAANEASALMSTGDPIRREAELVFSGGYAPFQEEIHRGFRKLDEARGPEGFKGQMRATRGLLRKRIEKITEVLPHFGGKNNPYLLGVTPLGAWLEKDQEATEMGLDAPAEQPKPSGGGGFFDR